MKGLLLLITLLPALLGAQSLPVPIVPQTWELYNYTPGPGRDIRYSSARLQVPYTRSINELLDMGYRFQDSAGKSITSDKVEYYYWKYRAILPTSVSGIRKRNLILQADNPEPYSLFLINGQPVSLAYANHMPVLKAFPATGFDDSVLLEVQLPSLYDAGVQDLDRSGSDKWPADNDTAEFKTSVVLRKPPVQFGWDVAPRRVLNGLGDGVKLYAFDHMHVLACWSKTEYITPQEARIILRWLVYADTVVKGRFTATLSGDGNRVFTADTLIEVQAGQQSYEMVLTVSTPRLWHALGQKQGGPFLYRLRLSAESGTDRFLQERSLGLRTIELKQNIDLRGREFRFAVNGENLFIRGVNVLPTYGFGGKSLEHKIWSGPRGLLVQLAASGYNMVRVWGGGGLMDDAFYRTCDSLGMLVWQDFPYSGSVYPYDGMWKRRALTGVIAMTEKLRDHACMALYCGNNEIDVALEHWGWEKTYGWSNEDSVFMRNQHRNFFHRDLPLVMREADPNTPYLPSSPVSNWAPTDEMRVGDNHLWFVWHGERPVNDLDRIVPRFASEYGMPSWPSYAVVRKHFGKNGAAGRMLSYKGLALLNRYMLDEFGVLPKDTQAIILLSQYLQARTLARAARAHMADTTCGGTLYWQLNDMWPGITWSTVDYEGHKKAAWFAMREVFTGRSPGPDYAVNPRELRNPGLKVKRKKRELTISARERALGVMILRDGRLLETDQNAFDLKPGQTVKLTLPEEGRVEVTTVWHLMTGQGFVLK